MSPSSASYRGNFLCPYIEVLVDVFFKRRRSRARQKGFQEEVVAATAPRSVSRGNDLSVYWSRHGRSASDGPHSGWLLARNGTVRESPTERQSQDRPIGPFLLCRKGHGPRKGDIRANSNADAGVDLILTVE